MPTQISVLRDKIVVAALPMVEQHGWSWKVVMDAADACGIQNGMEASIFPNGLVDAVAHFGDYADRLMMKKLEKIPSSSLRSKDKVRVALLTRYNVLENYKPVIKATAAFWSMPTHVIQGQRILWRTADRIWNWAGDTATDYNRQTKRAMLASIIMGTSMVWITDESEDNIVTQAFLDRRLENVMEFGRAIGTIKKVVPNIFRQANQNK
jgi:ubiquinone biosynthesis protein COQ9